jgi:hypothetical protein
MKYSCRMPMRLSYCCESEFREKLRGIPCLGLTGGSFVDDPVSDAPRFLFSFSSFLFIMADLSYKEYNKFSLVYDEMEIYFICFYFFTKAHT